VIRCKAYLPSDLQLSFLRLLNFESGNEMQMQKMEGPIPRTDTSMDSRRNFFHMKDQYQAQSTDRTIETSTIVILRISIETELYEHIHMCITKRISSLGSYMNNERDCSLYDIATTQGSNEVACPCHVTKGFLSEVAWNRWCHGSSLLIQMTKIGQ
jgi:hypothetical protein